VLSLTDELADHVCRGRDSRIPVVLGKLKALETSKPNPIQTAFDKLEARCAEGTSTATVTPIRRTVGGEGNSNPAEDEPSGEYSRTTKFDALNKEVFSVHAHALSLMLRRMIL
jgi:hypothetical protein